MSEFTADLCTLIAAASLGTAASTLFRGQNALLPTGDGPITRVIPTHGLRPMKVHNDAGAVSYERPRALVMVHAKSYDVAMARARAIRNVLNLANTTVNGTRYLCMRSLQEPFELEPDDSGRIRIVCNYEAEKEP